MRSEGSFRAFGRASAWLSVVALQTSFARTIAIDDVQYGLDSTLTASARLIQHPLRLLEPLPVKGLAPAMLELCLFAELA